MRFGMRAYVREEFKERSADKGVFYHEALDGFMRLVIDRGIDPGALTYEDVERLLAEVFEDVYKRQAKIPRAGAAYGGCGVYDGNRLR